VEIGYSIVPELQRRGLATRAVALLCDRAAIGGAKVVTAETLPALIASQGVLLKSGFERFETYQDAEAGEVWRFRRQAQLLRSK
jgi:RimJ/RimL family protein N-acetyltransferase